MFTVPLSRDEAGKLTFELQRVEGHLKAVRAAVKVPPIELTAGTLESLSIAARTIEDLSRGIGDSFAGIFFVDRGQFDRQREQLQAAFEAGRISAKEYQVELHKINEAQEEWVSLTGRLGRAFDSLGDGIRQVMRQVIADTGAAIARVAILKTLLTVFGGGGGFFGSVIRSTAASSGVTSGWSGSVQAAPARAPLAGLSTVSAAARPARPAAGPVHVIVSGRLVGEGNQLVGVIDTQSTIKSRTGRQR